MDEALSRDLTLGWCTKGPTFEEAANRMDIDDWRRVEVDFAGVGNGEREAAQHLFAFTGLAPSVGDDQSGSGNGRDAAADIFLNGPSGHIEAVEVTRSLDGTYQRSQSFAYGRFSAVVEALYSGHLSWQIDLERGWEGADLLEVASRVAGALNEAVSRGVDADESLSVDPFVTASVIGPTDPPRMFVLSANAGARNPRKPYLDELTDYLRTNTTILKKVRKLELERERVGAARTHLYVQMASTGQYGGLLPTSPSYFTWGTFTAPDGITDVWLEGGTGEVYHWCAESGWVFHSLPS